MAGRVKIEGLRELQRALAELPKATGKAVLRRVLLRRAKPIADAARAAAPVRHGHLARSIQATTRRPRGYETASQRAFSAVRMLGGSIGEARGAARAAGGAPVEVFFGAGRHPQAILQEFGTSHHSPQPYMRPAWDGGKDRALDGIADDLGAELRKTAARVARRRGRRG